MTHRNTLPPSICVPPSGGASMTCGFSASSLEVTAITTITTTGTCLPGCDRA